MIYLFVLTLPLLGSYTMGWTRPLMTDSAAMTGDCVCGLIVIVRVHMSVSSRLRSLRARVQ